MKKFVLLVLACVTGTFLFARQLTIQVIQHSDAWTTVGEQSLVVEDELMNGFFDYGCIVTNSVTSVSHSPEEDEELFHVGFGEAFDGLSELFVQVKLYFEALNNDPNKSKNDLSPSRLERADLVIMNVKSGEKILESSLAGSKKSPGTSENARIVSKSLITAIKKAL